MHADDYAAKHHVSMENGISDTFTSIMGVKQGCQLSPTHFSLCIDQLELIASKVAKEGFDGLELTCKSLFYDLYIYM